MTTKRPSQWKPGQSGNPRGKPAGSGELQRLRAAISEHIPGIIDELVSAARGGDVQAARLLLERTLPPMKPVELAQPLALPDGSLTQKAHGILDAADAGLLAPGQAAQLMGALVGLVRVAELDDLQNRIAALEAKHATS
jgi:hypothetical protein